MSKKKDFIFKTGTEEEWEKAKNYIPNDNVCIVWYMNDGSIQLSIGDGKTPVSDLGKISNKSSAPTLDGETLQF